MRRHRRPNAWEDWRFELFDITQDQGQYGDQPRLLRDDGQVASFLFPGLEVRLHRDEAEGYYLNLTSGAPAWFVMWRVDDADAARAWPEMVTLSYHEAARLLDAQERVDNLPLPPPLVAWMQAFADAHYRPEPKKRRRPASFLAPGER